MNKIKKLISYIIILVMIISAVPSVYAVTFDDINGHWGESYILKLIEDGTINGYSDNTFRPDGVVTRAEFVKMIGKSNVNFTSNFIDVPTSHWGYDYIMYSGLEGDEGKFNPDVPITRNDVLNLIWKRAGNVRGIIAPGIIKNQGTNTDAVAWAYTNGLIIGDDGVNLRLNESLTRAEASALIIRSREINENTKQINFIDTVSDELISVLYNSFNLFDSPYDANATISNGEMARAVLRYGARSHTLDSAYLTSKELFDGDYAKDLYLVSKECIDSSNVTKEFSDKNATVKDTLALLVYNAKKLVTKSLKMPKLADYEDTASLTAKLKNQISFARGYNIFIYNEDKIIPDKEITKKEFMCYLIQLDEIIGYGLSYETRTPSSHPISKNVAKYTQNFTDYEYILKDIPQIVYSTKLGSTSPKDSYDFGINFASSFKVMLDEISNKAEKEKCMINMTYYPSLVSKSDDAIIIRVKMHVLSAPSNININLSSVVNTSENVNMALSSNKTAYLDILIPPIMDVYIPSGVATVINVIE